MAATDEKHPGSALAAAVTALLGAGVAAPVSASELQNWSFDSALLYYGESDDRVQDLSAIVGAIRDFGDDRLLNFTLSADTLSGASASGAIALDGPQTFTSPSGRAVYETQAGEVPLDDTFLDTRFALSTSWTQPFARLYTVSGGLSFSTEYDYTHLGANASLARDFNKRNTTLSAGIAWSQDDVDPVGGAPLPLSQMLDVGDFSNKGGGGSKDVIDLLLGLTQVVNRTTLVRVNYSYSGSSGYMTDPYKILSVVDPVTGDTVARVPAPSALGPTGVYRYESRPDTRAKHSLYAEAKHSFGGPVGYLAYRFMTDDWGIQSHTLEGSVRWPIGAASYVEPLLRLYRQSEADFYRSSLVDGEPLPQHASADFRLGRFDAATLGLKFGHVSASGNEWSTRLEYYRQMGEIPSEQIVGNQAGREQYPDLDAVMIRVGYRFRL